MKYTSKQMSRFLIRYLSVVALVLVSKILLKYVPMKVYVAYVLGMLDGVATVAVMYFTHDKAPSD